MRFSKYFSIVVFAISVFAVSNALGAEEPKHVVIKKKSGSTIEGDLIKENPAWVRIRTKFGTLQINRVDILNIEEGISKLSQYKVSRKKIKDTDAKALLDLAGWCEENDLPREARDTYIEAAEIAGPYYIETKMRLGKVAIKLKEYRLAVLAFSELAFRLKQEDARKALESAEEHLYEGRIKLWKIAREEDENGNYSRAISAYLEALDRTIRDEPKIHGDIGRNQIIEKLLAARKKHLDEMKKKTGEPDLIATDRPGISWVFRNRPENLRRSAYDIPVLDLRINLENYVGQWLAVKGAYNGSSSWNIGDAAGIELEEGGHPELAVVVYKGNGQQKNLLDGRKRDSYLEELIEKYPYDSLFSTTDSVIKGNEVVCYGRLRKRNQYVPQYVFEVWAIETINEPEALELAANLKKPLRCNFTGAGLADVLDFINMVTQTEVEFEGGQIPEIDISLTVKGRPTGYVIGKLASECGLQWTRKGNKVLMKKDLTEKEKLLNKQVLNLASDNK